MYPLTATTCDICGKLYNLEERPVSIHKFGTRTSVQFFIRRDGAGRPYLKAIDTCPECADKVFKFVQAMQSDMENPEYIPSEYSS